MQVQAPQEMIRSSGRWRGWMLSPPQWLQSFFSGMSFWGNQVNTVLCQDDCLSQTIDAACLLNSSKVPSPFVDIVPADFSRLKEVGLKKFVEKIYECAKAAEPHFPSTEATVSDTLAKNTTGVLCWPKCYICHVHSSSPVDHDSKGYCAAYPI